MKIQKFLSNSLVLCHVREASFEAMCFAGDATKKIAGFLGIRDRYLFTKNNRLRLRYVATTSLFLVFVLPALMTLSTDSDAMGPRLTALNNMPGENSEISSLLDGSLYGQLSLASAALDAIPRPTDKIVTVESGDALGTVMQRAGIGASESRDVVDAMKEHFDPRRLRVGQDVTMHFVPDEGGLMQFASLSIAMDPIKSVKVHKVSAGYKADLIEKDVRQVVRAQKATIKHSLFGSAEKAGIPRAVVAEAMKIYSWNVDFQRDIREGDALEVMYDNFETDDGYTAKNGNVLYAKLVLSGKEIPLYRYEMEDGRVGYFDPEGRSIKRTLMSTPIDGARISSGFGMRRHPVLGYSKMHKGVDFAAARGTPIYAAGDGKVEYAGRFSSYGNYVRIRHNGSLKTAYAHMKSIAVKNGARVQQGEVIGYVGTTGRSTGPHLHYEVLMAGKQVNPRSVDLPTGEELAGGDLKAFKAKMRDYDMRYAKLANGVNVAFVEDEDGEGRRFN